MNTQPHSEHPHPDSSRLISSLLFAIPPSLIQPSDLWKFKLHHYPSLGGIEFPWFLVYLESANKFVPLFGLEPCAHRQTGPNQHAGWEPGKWRKR